LTASGVEHRHLALGVAGPLDAIGRDGPLDRLQVVGGEGQGGRPDVLPQPVELAGARDRDDPGLSRQQPGERELAGGGASVPGQAGEGVEQRPVDPQGLRLEPRVAGPDVALGEGGLAVEGAARNPLPSGL